MPPHHLHLNEACKLTCHGLAQSRMHPPQSALDPLGQRPHRIHSQHLRSLSQDLESRPPWILALLDKVFTPSHY